MKNYEIGLYEKSMPNDLTLKEKLKCSKECGFDFMEISIDETDEKLSRLNMTKDERVDLIKAMYEEQLYIRTMCLSGHRKYPLGSLDENTREKSLDIMKKAIDLADDLGIRIIQLAGYDVYYEDSNEQTTELFESNLKKCVEMASKKGIILAFETMETEFMNTIEKSMYYVDKINSPYLKVYPDCGNITNACKVYNTDVLDDFETGRGNIAAVHLKETVPGKFREIPFGQGHVNFEDVIDKALNMGVRKFVAEFWYCGEDDFKKTIKEAKAFMDDKFSLKI